MRYLLDTDVVSELARAKNQRLTTAVNRHELPELAVSPISLGEVRFGHALRPLQAAMLSRIEDLFRTIRCLPLNAQVASHYAELRAHLQRQGTPIGPNDNWIAAQALAEGLTLITGNEREFKRVPGLKVENWLR